MSLPIVILVGALDGAGIFFEPKEPYKWQILCAAMLKGVLTALLTGFSTSTITRLWLAILIGALYGLAFAVVIYLAKGGPKSGDAPDCHGTTDGTFHFYLGNQANVKARPTGSSNWWLNSAMRLA